jgi:AcrR family transcriptional regulator
VARPTTAICANLRRDATDNRQRIMSAAREAFAELGLSASLAEVARRAGVGNATLHRHFAGKDALIDAVYEEWVERRRAAGQAMIADPDPWEGLCTFLWDGLAEGSCNRAVGDLISVRGLEPLWGSLDEGLRRCQAAGVVADDVTTADLFVALLGVARTIDVTGDVAPDEWRRHLVLLLRGLRADADPPMVGREIAEDTLTDAVRRQVGRRSGLSGA